MNCNDVSNVLASTNSDLAEAIDCKRKRNNQIEIGLRKSTSMDMFPWMMEFRKMCRSSVAQRGPSLIKLIRSFNRNVSLNVNDCYKKSSRAAKLKELIKEALLLFMYFHRFEQPQDQNRAVYLEQMSDLLAVYIDLELVASKRDIEPQHKKISARLVSYLFIYLDNSTEFVLETLIKVQLVNETHGHVLDAIISKIFKIISKHPESEIMYVRYLLIYRIWKKVHSNLAVKKQINTNAISSLGSFPANMPKILLEQVLPSVPSTQATISESQSTKFYLCHPFDLRKACNQFMEYCRKSRNDEGTSPADDITERDPRLKSTLTSETNKVNNVNIDISKSSNSVDKSNSNKLNIPFAKLEIDNDKNSCSTVTKNNNSVNKTLVKAEIRKAKKLDDIVLIDLTDEEVTKIVKRKKRRKIGWLEDAKRKIDAKIKETALKRNKDINDTTVKIIEQHFEDTTRRSISSNVGRTELQTGPFNVSRSSIIDSESNDKMLQKPTVNSVEPQIKELNIKSSPPDSSSKKHMCFDNNKKSDEIKDDRTSILKNDLAVVIKRSDSMTVSSSKPLGLDEEKGSTSALRDVDNISKDKQPADSTVPSIETLKEVCSSNEEKISTVVTGTCSIINESNSNVASVSHVIVDSESETIKENRPVNSNLIKTDNYPNEQKVQQALKAERTSLMKINESLTCVEKKVDVEDNINVNSENIKVKSSSNHYVNDQANSHVKINDNVNIKNRPLQVDGTELPTTSNNFYDIQGSDIDGLTLLASVSAQQQVTGNKKTELRVKPYSTLQQKPKDDCSSTVINRIVGMYPEDTMDKVALQVEVTSTDLTSNSVNKTQQDQDTSSSDLLSYILDDTVQNNLENNDNANVILNGETVMLLQKSPNSNLYIINKAAVDNGKLNYNSDDEDANRLAEPEDTKCCQQGMIIKHEADEIGLRGRTIKPDPDYVDVKSNVHDDPKHPNQSQGYELHYTGYPVPPPGSYCTYPSIHHPSAGCACVSCYCRQMPYYLPATHATQSVQTNPTVQEMRCNKKTEAAAMLAKIYDDQILCNIEKEQAVVEEEKEIVRRFTQVDSKLPLKKRLRLSMDFTKQTPELPYKNDTITPAYPSTLMMSIADVEVNSDNLPHDLGAVVEVTSATIKTTKNRGGRREKAAANNKTNNHNVPNCFPRKTNSKKKRLHSTDEEVVNNNVSAPKKSRKSNGGVKQTRSSKRIVPTVNYVYPENDTECNPTSKPKKKRNSRWTTTKAS